MKNFLSLIKKGFFPFIIAFTALSVSASAAFYSVSGLSKLFAGASFEVIIMAGSLEVAKLIVASLLYQYWDTINKLLKVYLTIATVILVLITSMGIYGFLSAAYQDTYRQLTIKENQVSFLDQKKQFYEKDVIRYDQELERISNNISTLSNAKVSNIQVRDTSVSSGFRSTISTTELRLSQKRIEVEEKNRQKVQTKREVAADSLQKYQIEILTLENNAEIAGELGPLQYLSGLTGIPMDKIINYLLLVIIFVFDPLAISLVIAANFAFVQAFPKREKDVLSVFDNDDKWGDGIDEAISLAEEKDFSLEDFNEEESEKRMDIIGRNGNDGEHYEELSNKYEGTSEKIRTLTDDVDLFKTKISSIDEYLNKNAPYYGEKASATKSIEDFYGEEKPSPESPKKSVTKIYDWNKTERSAPIPKPHDISNDPSWPPPDDSDDTKTY